MWAFTQLFSHIGSKVCNALCWLTLAFVMITAIAIKLVEIAA